VGTSEFEKFQAMMDLIIQLYQPLNRGVVLLDEIRAIVLDVTLSYGNQLYQLALIMVGEPQCDFTTMTLFNAFLINLPTSISQKLFDDRIQLTPFMLH
jgi:hypothetical protein